MNSIFTEEHLNNMSRENLVEIIKIMKNESSKKEQEISKKEQEIRLLKEREKELEFLNALLSDRLTLAQKKRFGSSSEKYAEGYEQMNLFNEAETDSELSAEEPTMEEIHPSSYKRKKRTGKKEEDLSTFEVWYYVKKKYKLNVNFSRTSVLKLP